jgi:hypothetical protein
MTYAGDRTSEPSLYDLDAAAEAEALQIEEEASTNGAHPAPIEYLETEDETELRSLIFQTSDVLEELLTIPEWKVDGKVVRVLIRGLNARELTQFLQANMKNGELDLKKVYPEIVILTARHPVTKKLLFKPTDRDALLQKMGKAIDRIAMKASDLSGMSQRAQDVLLKN